MKLLLINGPNLNLLGEREPELYGSTSFDQLIDHLREISCSLGIDLRSEQSNHEGVIIDIIHEARPSGSNPCSGILINPGAYTHTSVAIRDALLAVNLPAVEIHLSQTANREIFRHHSYISDVVLGSVSGFGVYGYELALRALHRHLSRREQ